MSKPYFSRRWVIQELALAREATLQCGEQTISWEEFATAVAIFEKHSPLVNDLAKKKEEWGNQADYFGDIETMGATRLVQTTNILYRKSDRGEITNRLLDLESLVSILPTFESSIKHDTVYAVLALAKDTWHSSSAAKAVSANTDNGSSRASAQQPGAQLDQGRTREIIEEAARRFKAKKEARESSKFPVNYEADFVDVCKEFINFAVQKSKALDIICRPWAPAEDDNLPSWIPTLEGIAFAPKPSETAPGDFIMNRLNADPPPPPVGMTSNQNTVKPYNANKRTGILGFKFGKPESHDAGSLYTDGFILNTVATIGDASQSGMIPKEWFTLADWPQRKWPPRESFWRTLVGDRGPDGGNTPIYFRRSFQEIVDKSVRNGDINTTWQIHHGGSSLTKEYLKRCQAVIWGRRLMKTEANDLLGLAPARAEKGDRKFILIDAHQCTCG